MATKTNLIVTQALADAAKDGVTFQPDQVDAMHGAAWACGIQQLARGFAFQNLQVWGDLAPYITALSRSL